MKQITDYIIEKFKLNSKTINNIVFFGIESTNKNEGVVEFEPSKNDKFNSCFDWISKHCQIRPYIYKDENVDFKVDKVLFKTNKYELNSVVCYIYPNDKELIQSNIIRTQYKRLADKFKDGLKEDEKIGVLVPFSVYQKGRNSYGELIFTKNGILWNYIDDYAITISNEKLIK